MVATVTERNIGERLRSAARIEPDRFPRLKTIGAAWAESLAGRINALAASRLTVEFSGIASVGFSPDMEEIDAAALVLTVRSSKFRETAFISADAFLPATLAEAVFGGDGRNRFETARSLSNVERFFADQALRYAVETGNTVFEDVVPMAFVADKLLTETIGEKLDALLPDDGRSFVEFQFRIAIGRCESTLRIAVPEAVLAPHRRKFAVVQEDAPSIVDESWARDLEAGFQQTDLHVRALLGEKSITLGEIATFQIGQTIALDTTMESLILVECEGQRMFRGRMGRSRDSYVVRIEETVDPTEEFIDDILAD